MVVTVKGAVAVVAVPAIASLLGIIWFQRKRQKHLSGSDRFEKPAADGQNRSAESSDSFDSGKVSQPESLFGQETENGSNWSSAEDNGTPESTNTPELCDESLRGCVDDELFQHCLTDKCSQGLSYDLQSSVEDRLSSGYGSMSLTSVNGIHGDDYNLAADISPANSGFSNGNHLAISSNDLESKVLTMCCRECISDDSFLEPTNEFDGKEGKIMIEAPSGEHDVLKVEPIVDKKTESMKHLDKEQPGDTIGNLDDHQTFNTVTNFKQPEPLDGAESLFEPGCSVRRENFVEKHSGETFTGTDLTLEEERAFNSMQCTSDAKLRTDLECSACDESSMEAVCLTTIQPDLVPSHEEIGSTCYIASEENYSMASSSSAILDYEGTGSLVEGSLVSGFYNFVREFEFPSHLCGMLIGRNGRNIRRVSRKSRTMITIQFHPSKKDFKVIYIRGCNGEDVEEAFATISRMFPDEVLRWPEYIYSPTFHQGIGNIDNATVLVVSIVTANHVFLQVPEQVQEVALLTQAMNYFYACSVGQPLDTPVCESTLCAASLGGSNWFRAEVVESSLDQNSCVLKFVDVGGYAMTDISHLRKLRDDFEAVPYQASECYLFDVLPPDGKEVFRYGTVTFLEGMVRGVQLMCKVNCHAADGVPCVTLCVFHSDMMVNVNQQLIAHGYAVSS